MEKIILLSLLILFASGVSALGTTPKSNGVVIITLDPVNTTNDDGILPLAELYVWWNWSGSLSIPDGSSGSGTWVGIDCSTPSSVPSGATVTKVAVHHEITHTFIGDLEVKIYNEQTSHEWIVRYREGGDADNINETRTEYNIFDGDNPTQEWYYRVRDVWGGDTGTLDVMQLYVYYQTNESPTLNLTEPSSNIMVSQGDPVTITWTDSDPEENAYIALAYDTDCSEPGHTWITVGLREDPDGSGDQYLWDTSGVPTGTYRIWGTIYDTVNPIVYDCAPGSITITSEHCYTCPTYDYGTYTPNTSYSTHSASFDADGCRWYRFDLNAGETYRFTTCEGGGSYSDDTVFTLYNSSCSQVASNDDTCSLGSEIEYTPTSSGYYYLRVENYSGGSESYTLAYKIVNQPPTFDLTGPSSDITVLQGDIVTITWTDSDPDDNAYIALAYDSDCSEPGHTWITVGLREDPDGSGDQYLWDTSGVPTGTYRIWGTIYDTVNPIVYDCAPGSVTINPPPTVDIRIEPNLLEFEYSPSIGSPAASYDREPLQVERFMESSMNEQVQLPAYDGPQQSKTGPTPPPGVPEKIREIGILAEVTLPSVPPYSWRHGCGPTAVGMVVGYHDSQSYNDLITGDASTQTDEVNQAIASGGTSGSPYPSGSEQHYEDYSRPEDPPPGVMQTDDYITQARIPHSDNCIGDYMDTSKSTRDNRYGWSWSSDVGPSFVSYVDQQNLSYNPSYQQYQMGSTLTWNILTTEIENGRPMVFLVDTDADGGTDHFVTVMGYRDTPSQQYGCLDTWAPADIVRWCDFAQMSDGQPWGIWGGWSFSLAPLSEDSFTIYNDGTADLEVNSISKRDGDAWLASWAPDAPFTIVPGGSQTVVVNIDGALGAPGLNEEQLIVLSNDDDKSPYPGGVYVNLTVTCVSTTIEQPPQDITICEGQDAVFDIAATGSEPLHYQWKKDGVDVGSDSSTLILPSVQLEDDGSEIWCEVTNVCDSVVVSTSAFLTVYPWPTVTINPNPDQLNAAWILDGPNGYTDSNNGDETIADLEFGSYTITWSTIPRWNTPLPNPDTKSLSVGNSINFIGNYQLIADLNNDYSVDYEDLARLANEWLWTGQSGGIPEDIMQDGIVNFADFALLARNWLAGI